MAVFSFGCGLRYAAYSRLEINKMIKAIGGEDEEIVLAIANSSLNILLRNKELVLLSGKYELSKEGLKRITDLLKYRWSSNIILDEVKSCCIK